MRTCVISTAVIVTLLVARATHRGAQEQASSYSVQEVRALLEEPPGVSSSFSEKTVQHLGDRISIAVMKIYPGNELKNPNNIRRFLAVIPEAFRIPRLISIPEDREPRVTLVLLQFLQAQVKDAGLEAEIKKTQQLVLQETSPQ